MWKLGCIPAELELNSCHLVEKKHAISSLTDTLSSSFSYIACLALRGIFFEKLLRTKRTGSCLRGRKKAFLPFECLQSKNQGTNEQLLRLPPPQKKNKIKPRKHKKPDFNNILLKLLKYIRDINI